MEARRIVSGIPGAGADLTMGADTVSYNHEWEHLSLFYNQYLPQFPHLRRPNNLPHSSSSFTTLRPFSGEL